VPTERLSALQAGLVHGSQAVALGLADAVATLDQVLALVRSGADVAAASAQTPTTTEDTMAEDTTPEKAYRASLQAVIDDEKSDDKAKAKAKAILAAMDGEPDGDEKKDPPDEGKKAEGDEPHKEPDGDEGKPAATASAADLSRLDRIERRQLMSTRPDLSEAQRTALASVPVSALEAALAAIPRASAKPAATATVSATRGEGQGPSNGVPALVPNDELDRAFGGARAESPVRKDKDNPLRTYFGTLTREQAKAITAKHTGGAQ
jgi:hypothetical protein